MSAPDLHLENSPAANGLGSPSGSASLVCVCKVCGNEFQAGSINEARRRITCSYKCAAIHRWGVHSRDCAECGKSFTAKKSDAKMCCSPECSNRHMSATKKRLKQHPNQQAVLKANATCQTEEYRVKMAKLITGRKHTKPKTARHSALHARASVFFVKSPQNVTYLVMNVTKFVAEHEHLFPPETVKWRKSSRLESSQTCPAVNGLCKINRGYRGTWRGWMKVGNLEGKEAIDLLPRTFVGPNVSDQIPRTEDVANTTDSPERLSASDLFAPCDGCVNVETCKTIGCIAKELEETL